MHVLIRGGSAVIGTALATALRALDDPARVAFAPRLPLASACVTMGRRAASRSKRKSSSPRPE